MLEERSIQIILPCMIKFLWFAAVKCLLFIFKLKPNTCSNFGLYVGQRIKEEIPREEISRR